MLIVFLALLLLSSSSGVAWAQSSDGPSNAELGESAEAVRTLRAVSGKTLVFVFDVSGSMRGPNLSRAREATINLLREAAGPGDRVVLLSFGAGYSKVFDATINSESDKNDLVGKVPSEPVPGAGSNIRRPHHEALKILDAALPKPGAVVLLTDSFNDEPRRTDPTYADYTRYYTPGGRLAKYPDTRENRDYERLLAKMRRSRKVTIYGIGVQIDESGRPVERLPQAAPPPVETGPTLAPAVATPVARGGGTPWPWIALAGALVAGAGWLLLPLTRAAPLRVSGGPAGAKDFRLKNGQQIKIGGEGAQFAGDAYPLPGVLAVPALIKGQRGQFTLAPGTLQTPGVAPARVFHNGIPLEKPVGLSYGDEVRVSVPPADGGGVGVAKEFRLKFEDPTKSF